MRRESLKSLNASHPVSHEPQSNSFLASNRKRICECKATAILYHVEAVDVGKASRTTKPLLSYKSLHRLPVFYTSSHATISSFRTTRLASPNIFAHKGLHAHLLPSLRKHLPHPTRQLIPNQPRKNHNILRRIPAALNHIPQRRRLIPLRPQMRGLVGQTDDSPDHGVADRARKHRWRDVERLGLGADGGRVAAGVVFEGEDVGGADGL